MLHLIIDLFTVKHKGQFLKLSFFNIRSNAFHLPDDVSKPIIMVGPGCGIAPFRGFWQQRQMDLQFSGSSRSERRRLGIGDMVLVFGCRQSEVDYLHEPEIAEATEDGTISNVYTAFSRESDQPKVL